jgi:hypothetical protein
MAATTLMLHNIQNGSRTRLALTDRPEESALIAAHGRPLTLACRDGRARRARDETNGVLSAKGCRAECTNIYALATVSMSGEDGRRSVEKPFASAQPLAGAVSRCRVQAQPGLSYASRDLALSTWQVCRSLRRPGMWGLGSRRSLWAATRPRPGTDQQRSGRLHMQGQADAARTRRRVDRPGTGRGAPRCPVPGA